MVFRLRVAAMAVSGAGAFHFGFQLVVTDPAEDTLMQFTHDSFKHHFHSTLSDSALHSLWSIVVALFFVGAMAGALSIKTVADRLGRRKALLASYVVNFVSLLLSSAAYFVHSFELYAIARTFLGLGICVSVGVGALFLAESSPKHMRGSVSATTGIAVQLGLVFGALIAMPQTLGTSSLWWLIYAIEASVLAVAAAYVYFLPDSPVFLTVARQDKAAVAAIVYFHGLTSEEAENKLVDFQIEQASIGRKLGLFEIWTIPEKRHRAIIGVVSMTGTAFSGVAAINAFAVDILTTAGFSTTTASLANVGLTVISFFAAILSSVIVDRYGRRPLLLLTSAGIFVSNVLVGVFLLLHESHDSPVLSSIMVVLFGVFLAFFALGPGPLSYFITAELNDQSSISAAQSWTSFTQTTVRAFLLAVFLPLKTAIGPAWAYWALFLVPIASTTTFLYFHLPETKNRNQKELLEAFHELPTLPCSSKSKTRLTTTSLTPALDSMDKNSYNSSF